VTVRELIEILERYDHNWLDREVCASDGERWFKAVGTTTGTEPDENGATQHVIVLRLEKES